MKMISTTIMSITIESSQTSDHQNDYNGIDNDYDDIDHICVEDDYDGGAKQQMFQVQQV